MTYVIITDKAFPLKSYLVRPYCRVLIVGTEENKIFNYWLFWTKRVVKNSLIVEEYSELTFKYNLNL